MATFQGTELSVALLMDDLASAKEIASALRQQNIYAHLYQNLEDFWVSSTLLVPHLIIVDVTKMSQGDVQFRNHPKVQDKSMSYAFFAKESTKFLLQSTYGLHPLGFIYQDSSISSQVRSLVSRRLSDLKRVREKADLESKVQKLEARAQRILTERTEAEEFKASFEFIRNLCWEIEEESLRQDFTHTLLGKLEKWEAISGYGILELSQNGQKLISPEVSRKKFHPFPSLWLGQTNTHGIEPFAQDMATQVANDLFEIAPVTIRLYAGSSNPDLLLFISFKEERMLNFPWDVLESMLSSSLRRLKLHQQLPQYSSQFLPLWEALDNMDRMQKGGIEAEVRIVALSLVPLTDVAKKRSNNKFFWSSFFNDFFLQLSGRMQKTSKLSLFGPWHVLFFIPKENLETETQMLQAFVKQFSYWKFFEDNSQVLSEDMIPTLRLIPASSSHYLRAFEKDFQDIGTKEEAKKLMALAREPKRAASLR